MAAELSQDAFLQKFFERIPQNVTDSLTADQRTAIEKAVQQQWATHPVDIRYSFGFWRWRYFFVFLAGRDRRVLTRRQERFFTLAEFYMLMGFLTFSTLLGLLVLYLIKSWMGIDIFPNFSFGIWTWFNANVFHTA
ncbi:MAG: hypothetical protein ACWA44_13560 [Thiotrichales bacterium]